MNFFAITWDPSLGIDLGFFTIRWYSLMFVAAFVIGLRLMKKIYIKENINLDKLDTLFMYTFISMLVGMRFGEVFFYSWDYYKNNLKSKSKKILNKIKQIKNYGKKISS